MKKAIKNFGAYLKVRLKEGWGVTVVSALYILLCYGSCVYFGIIGKTQNCLMCIVFPLIVVLMYMLEYALKMKIPVLFAVVFYLMASSNILGNGYELYGLVYGFDKIMHTLSGVAFTCVGYAFVMLAVRGDDGKKFVYCLVGAFAICMAIAAMWEMYEYFVTAVLKQDMQLNYTVDTINLVDKIAYTEIYDADGILIDRFDGYIDVGLFDTLQDILVCFIGSAITIIALVIERACKKKAVKKLFVPRVLALEEAEKMA